MDLLEMFYSDPSLVNLLDNKNESNIVTFLGLNSDGQGGLIIDVYKMICMVNQVISYSYSPHNRKAVKTNTAVLNPNYSVDGYMQKYEKVVLN